MVEVVGMALGILCTLAQRSFIKLFGINWVWAPGTVPAIDVP